MIIGTGIPFAFIQAKNKDMLTIILFIAGIISFVLFFKCVDFFEKV